MDIMEELATRGAILRDHHFVYKSGTHGPHYINMDPVFPDTMLMKELGVQLGSPFWLGNETAFWPGVGVVVGAATGGIPLAYATALGFSTTYSVPTAWAWADKVGDDFAFERAGFAERLEGKRLLVVEDLLNTGDTTRKVIAQARRHGAEVIGVSVVCNRGPETAESLDVPRLEALATVDFQVLDAETCPLCADGQPIVEDIGHGAKFKENHPDYAGGYVKLLAA